MQTYHMKIDFPNDLATLTGINDTPIIKNISSLSKFTNQWDIRYYFEVPLNKQGHKLTFSWSQWIEHENFFKLELYYPFPDNIIPTPPNYNPRQTLANWSYIPRPQKGTLQKSCVYRNNYNHVYLHDKDIQFEMIGKDTWPTWNTNKYTDGYWY